MILLGTIVNVISIIIGSVVGLFLTRIPEKYKRNNYAGHFANSYLNGVADDI